VRIAVVGAGVVGTSTTAALLGAGHEVDCFEPGTIMGERSAGSTRIFRLAHTDPDLVRLAERAKVGFDRWSDQAGRPMLINSGCVVTGTDMADRAAAMAEAGVAHEVVGVGSGRLRLPVRAEPAVALIDVGGGVVDVDAVRDFLSRRAGAAVVPEPVHRIDVTPGGAPRVTAAGGPREYDALLVAAGMNTTRLAAQVGIHTPRLIAHHLRATFRVDGDGWQSWIDKPADRPGTYQHRSGPGRWAVGGHVDPALTAWEVGKQAAVDASRSALVGYAREHLAVDPELVDSLYCTFEPQLGDGVQVRRSGPVVVVFGDNLMKFAPVLGNDLAVLLTDQNERPPRGCTFRGDTEASGSPT
jgi:sarcosine oxidase